MYSERCAFGPGANGVFRACLFLVAGLVAFTCISPPLWAGAFGIPQLGARASGMGTAFTALASDGSAMYYNPAGIAFQPGTKMEMDTLVVVGLFRFFPSSPPPGTVVPDKGFPGSVKPHFIPVANMYATHQFSDKLTFGFATFAPFGLSANFTNFNDSDPKNTKYPGRFAGTRARLETLWIQPTIGYKVTPNTSIGLGVAIVHTHLFIESSFLNPLDDALDFGREAADTIFPGLDPELAARSIARLLPEGRSRIAGTSNHVGFNAGILHKFTHSKTNIGLSWRSAVTNHLKGKASFAFGTDYPLKDFIGSDLLPKAFPNQPITGSFTEPATYAIGIANSKYLGSTFSMDFRCQDFTRFSSVPLNFSITRATNPDVRTPAERRLVFNFRNDYDLAFGWERPIKDGFVVRAGYNYDRSPVIDASVNALFPDANRHSFTVGATKTMGNKQLTLYYEAMHFVDRTTDVAANAAQGTNGEYRNFAHLAGLQLRIALGKDKTY